MVTEPDAQAYLQTQKLIDSIDRQSEHVPVDYIKSTPYLMSFMKDYKLKQHIEDYFRKNPGEVEKINKMFHVTTLDVYVSAEGMERWDAEHLFVPKMIRRGLLEVDDVRKIPPSVGRTKDRDGKEFYIIHLVIGDEKPVQNIRWVGAKRTFKELNDFNAHG